MLSFAVGAVYCCSCCLQVFVRIMDVGCLLAFLDIVAGCLCVNCGLCAVVCCSLVVVVVRCPCPLLFAGCCCC